MSSSPGCPYEQPTGLRQPSARRDPVPRDARRSARGPDLDVTLNNVPTHITRAQLLSQGIKFKEVANEKVGFDDELRGSRAELGFGSTTKYNIVLKFKSFSFGAGPHNVTLKPHASDIGNRQSFKVKIRVVATDGSGNRRTTFRTVQVGP